MTNNPARIHDLGYRPYDGPRHGLGWAMASLGLDAIRRVLGLKRAARHKVLPVICILIAFVPAIVFVGMAAFLPESLLDEGILPSYGDYYGFIVTAMYLFASFVAPEAICTDRRTGMLALYLASPLDRTTYVVTKVASVAVTLLLITLLPMLFLLLAYTIEGAGPDGIGAFVELLLRILAVGVTTALFFAAFSSVISSFTPRRGIASAAIVMSMLIPGIVVGSLLDSTDAADRWALLNVGELPLRSATYLLGETPFGDRGLDAMAGSTVLLVTGAAIAAFCAVTWWRYQRLEVPR